MAARDLYKVLGVNRTETLRGIRAAYRDLAKRYHPDRVGQSGTRRFQDISAAYETLGDPEKRRAYNAELDEASDAVGPASGSAGPLRVEPLSVLHGPARYRPSLEALEERFARNFTWKGVPKSDLLEGLNFEVVLSTEEAALGVLLPLDVPTIHACPACGGTGHQWLFACLACRAEGTIELSQRIWLRIPPPVVSGTIHELALDEHGIHNFYLRVHLFVSDELETQV